MKNVGVLWDMEVEWDDEQPFQIKNLDEDYRVYSELAENEDLKLYIAKYNWYEDGVLRKAWVYEDGWKKVEDIEIDGVYDKYKFDSETHELKKEIAENLPVLNNPELERICKDKLETYELFPEHVPETMIATEENVEEMLEKYNMVVFKPRYGAMGSGVEFIEDIEEFEEPDEPQDFILQRFIKTEGFEPIGIEGPHDLRTHVINGEFQEGNYVRVPNEGLKSNIAQGGDQIYIDNSDIPEEALNIIDEVSEEFSRFNPSVFSVDFMMAEGRPWLVELNSKPGMYYHYPVKEKEHELPRMKALVKALADLFER